jgi:hypothetical protein
MGDVVVVDGFERLHARVGVCRPHRDPTLETKVLLLLLLLLCEFGPVVLSFLVFLCVYLYDCIGCASFWFHVPYLEVGLVPLGGALEGQVREQRRRAVFVFHVFVCHGYVCMCACVSCVSCVCLSVSVQQALRLV